VPDAFCVGCFSERLQRRFISAFARPLSAWAISCWRWSLPCQVADAPAGVFRSGGHALGAELGPEPGHMQWRVMLADGVEGLIPGRQDFAGRGVDVAASSFVPDRQVVAVEADDVGGGPPDLVAGGGDDLAQVGASDGAAQGDVGVRSEPSLGRLSTAYF
jgi:hypothetical protein